MVDIKKYSRLRYTVKQKLILIIINFCLTFAFANESTSLFKKGLFLLREGRYQDSIDTLERSIQNQELTNQSAAYYLIGIANFEIENYASALNSFETALDISTDIKLDGKIDEFIDRTIVMQNFQESGHLKNKIYYFASLNYDSNQLNLNKENFAGVNLNAYSLSYGLNYSRILFRTLNLELTPEISLADSYTVDSKFSGTSTIQSTDTLQFAVQIPLQINENIFSKNDTWTPILGFKILYLPTESEKRSQAFSSVFIGAKSNWYLTEKYIFSPAISYSSDKSNLIYADSDDQQSGQKLLIDLNNSFTISEEHHRINFNLSAEMNTADGKNSSYNKGSLFLEVRIASIPDHIVSIHTRYLQTDYLKSTLQRNDRQNSVGIEFLKKIDATKNISLNMINGSNNSSSAINSYQDSSIGISFFDQISF